MNKQVKKIWVAELRNPEHKQGKGTLCEYADEGNKYCCLGILTMCAIRDNGAHTENMNHVMPTDDVRAWAGLGGAETLFIDGETASLDIHNDGQVVYIGMDFAGLPRSGCKPKTFAQIADAIEEQL